MTSSHQECTNGHICQDPSGLICAKPGCDEKAGTWWGPYWCPEHDKERLDRISDSLDAIGADLADGRI